ncbi:MAG TPA: hypothetical protein VI935_05500 [Thermodesulfobacteriota bacterium]|nr:hypothetical protein [Thermodesulfobacteriota bacterium]
MNVISAGSVNASFGWAQDARDKIDIVGDCLAGLVRQSGLENPDYPFVCYPFGYRLDFFPDVFVEDQPFVPA